MPRAISNQGGFSSCGEGDASCPQARKADTFRLISCEQVHDRLPAVADRHWTSGWGDRGLFDVHARREGDARMEGSDGNGVVFDIKTTVITFSVDETTFRAAACKCC